MLEETIIQGNRKMKIAIIGCGTIGSGMASQWAKSHQLFLFDRTFAKAEKLAQKLNADLSSNCAACPTILEAIKDNDLILLAFKPQNLTSATESFSQALTSNQLLASVLAGVTLDTLRRYFPHGQLLRVMPNIALNYGQGVIGLTNQQFHPPFSKEIIEELFGLLGWIHWVDEAKIDALSALAGSGMAFAAAIMEAGTEASIAMGLNAEEGLNILIETFTGTITTLKETGMHPGQLKWKVSSPGGTTIAGLFKLEEKGLRSALMETFLATYKRNQELGKKI